MMYNFSLLLINFNIYCPLNYESSVIALLCYLIYKSPDSVPIIRVFLIWINVSISTSKSIVSYNFCILVSHNLIYLLLLVIRMWALYCMWVTLL